MLQLNYRVLVESILEVSQLVFEKPMFPRDGALGTATRPPRTHSAVMAMLAVAYSARLVPLQSMTVTLEPAPFTARGRVAIAPQLAAPYTPAAMVMVTKASKGTIELETLLTAKASVAQGWDTLQGAVSTPDVLTYRVAGAGWEWEVLPELVGMACVGSCKMGRRPQLVLPAAG